MRWFKRSRTTQTCWVYCPCCKAELTAIGHVYSDDDQGVIYHCAACHWWSRWDFDAPVPLLIEGEHPVFDALPAQTASTLAVLVARKGKSIHIPPKVKGSLDG